MKQLFSFLTAGLFSTLLIITSAASAQDAPIMALDPTLMAGWSGNLAYGNTAARSSTATTKSYTYKSTPALRQQVVAKFAKRLQTQSTQGAQALTSTFGAGKMDYDDVYKQLLKTSALHNYDAVDALTGLMLAGYQIVNNVQDEQITAAMERAARSQVAAIMAKNAKLSSATNRAQMSEELKLQTVLLALGWQETVKNNTLATYRKNIAAMFKSQYHLDFANMKLTSQGFAKR